MTRISTTRRLAWGLGVIALGVLGAMPFRRSPADAWDDSGARGELVLPQRVPLQLPGQPAVANYDLANLEPLVDELDAETSATPTVTEQTSIVEAETAPPPPRLPDEYRPLFRPDDALSAGQPRAVTARDLIPVARHTVRKHTIHDGDTLERLATRYLGDARHAEAILAANRAVLKDPQVLPIGVEIVIPRLSAEVPHPEGDGSATRNLVPLPATGLTHGQ